MDKLLITSNYHYITMACKSGDNIDHIVSEMKKPCAPDAPEHRVAHCQAKRAERSAPP
ncbi:hypothetical protein [Pusillimonas minor]|uniref:Uncharacterized protein n=1 Tax=Pusillimonas minor TaxID=2697024 RepID=A0A842HQH8_9BURK|nr:hypothetical protein [Pusillimonas minor]MBC2770466.1 hypothetical protein [Pusillimonas minor]